VDINHYRAYHVPLKATVIALNSVIILYTTTLQINVIILLLWCDLYMPNRSLLNNPVCI
jgi:hypothetical protein